jgi:hypothetical protein
MEMPKMIGVAGLARSGKDTFVKLLSQRMDCVRYALADKLKEELRGCLSGLYNIDILSCSPEEKKVVRPLLVAHGKIRRDLSEGRYWYDALDKIIYNDREKIGNKIVVVSDIRFAAFKEDEVAWLRQNKGVLVHIRKYTIKDGVFIYDEPPNEEERQNDPLLQVLADYRIEWPDYVKSGQDESILFSYVNNFVHWYNERIE